MDKVKLGRTGLTVSAACLGCGGHSKLGQARGASFGHSVDIVRAALKPGNQPLKAPLVMRLVTAIPWLQGITARFVGVGVRPEHVQSSH